MERVDRRTVLAAAPTAAASTASGVGFVFTPALLEAATRTSELTTSFALHNGSAVPFTGPVTVVVTGMYLTGPGEYLRVSAVPGEGWGETTGDPYGALECTWAGMLAPGATGGAVVVHPSLSSDDRAAVTRSLSVAPTDPGVAPASISIAWPPNP